MERHIRLGAIFNLVGGGTPSTAKEAYWGIGTPWFSSADISLDGKINCRRNVTPLGIQNSTTNVVPAKTVVVVTRVGLGKVSKLPCDMCFSQDIQALQPTPQTPPFNESFLMYQLSHIMKRVKFQGRGTTISGITKKQLSDIILYLPSLVEQNSVVSRIEELFPQLDASVAELKTAKERLKVYRQAVLKEAFDQCKEFVPLSSLGDLGRGKSKHRPRNDPALFEDGKYPFIQTGDVKAASKYITGYSKMYGPLGLQQSKLWPKGTLCITIAANIAETAFLGIDACFPDSVVGFTPQENVLPEYIRFFIESQKQRLWAFAPATAQKNINLDTLEKLMIPYCPVDEQRAIIRETDSKITICDNIEQTINTSLQQAEALRQSILKKAFEGVL